MTFAERLLLFFAKEEENTADLEAMDEWDLESALSLMSSVFPGFMEDIMGKTILDFGCGSGWQTVSLALHGARYVLGVEVEEVFLKEARELALKTGVDNRVGFVEKIDAHHTGCFDIVISQNSMEHFRDPLGVLHEMKCALKPNGKCYITFGPPWLAPYGSHMHFFTRFPWVNIFFPEDAVMKVRSRFRSDGARRYEEVQSGLNKMTVERFGRMVKDKGLQVVYEKFACVKGMNIIGRVPMLREFVTNRASFILIKTRNDHSP